MSESELWRDVVGYEGYYKVSNKGNVFSVERKDSRGNKCGGITIKPTNRRDGYDSVLLHKNGVRKYKYIHRLVAEAFVPNHNKYLEINHKDEVKDNNNANNLEWCTGAYNVNHGTRNKRVSQKLSKRVRAVNVETGKVLTFNSTVEAGRKGYARTVVSRACRGIYCGGNTYKGHKWSYE